jgi:hypothetical protein
LFFPKKKKKKKKPDYSLIKHRTSIFMNSCHQLHQPRIYVGVSQCTIALACKKGGLNRGTGSNGIVPMKRQIIREA